jgi:hypothetical protein
VFRPELEGVAQPLALATTMLTTPLLLLLRKGTEIEEPIARSGFLGHEEESLSTDSADERRFEKTGK